MASTKETAQLLQINFAFAHWWWLLCVLAKAKAQPLGFEGGPREGFGGHGWCERCERCDQEDAVLTS